MSSNLLLSHFQVSAFHIMDCAIKLTVADLESPFNSYETPFKSPIFYQIDPSETATSYFLLQNTTKLIFYRNFEVYCTHYRAEP